MRLKRALSQIKPNEGQREKIYGDILDRLDKLSEETSVIEKETRFVMKKRKIFTAAAVCALVLACGLTVSAANFGWGHKLFGSSAAVIERDLDDYSVEIGNVQVENAEGVPYKFTLGDVISDGYLLYANILIEDIEVEDPDAYKKDVVYSGQFSFLNVSIENNIPWSTTMWQALDTTENSVNTIIQLNLKEKIEKGDVFELRLEDDNRRLDYTNHIDAAENDRAFLADLSFTVKSDVKDVRKVIDVNQTATFTDRMFYLPDFPEEMERMAENEDNLTKTEFYVEQVRISPLSLEIKGKVNWSEIPHMSTVLNSWGNVSLVYKNGEKKRLYFNPKTGHSLNDKGPVDTIIYSDFHQSHFGNFSVDVQDLNEIEAIEFDGFTVPFGSGEAAE